MHGQWIKETVDFTSEIDPICDITHGMIRNNFKFVLKEMLAIHDIKKGEMINPSNAIPVTVDEFGNVLPHFKVEAMNDAILLTDLGPWDFFPTITNRPNQVVEFLYAYGYLKPGQRLFYMDEMGIKDRIHHVNGKFTEFGE